MLSGSDLYDALQRRAVSMSAYPPPQESRAGIEAEGWSASATVVPKGGGWAWVVRATKGGRTIEERGATEPEAWHLAHRHAQDIAAAEQLKSGSVGSR
jgi:hypothetical protein